MIDYVSARVGKKSVALIGIAAAEDINELIHVEIYAEISYPFSRDIVIDSLGKGHTVKPRLTIIVRLGNYPRLFGSHKTSVPLAGFDIEIGRGQPAVVHINNIGKIGISDVAYRYLGVLTGHLVKEFDGIAVIGKYLLMGGKIAAKHIEYAFLRVYPLVQLIFIAADVVMHTRPAPSYRGSDVRVHTYHHDYRQRQKHKESKSLCELYIVGSSRKAFFLFLFLMDEALVGNDLVYHIGKP